MSNPFKAIANAAKKAGLLNIAKAATKAVPGGVIFKGILDGVGESLGLETRDPDAIAAAIDNSTPEEREELARIDANLKIELDRNFTKRAAIHRESTKDAQSQYGGMEIWNKIFVDILALVIVVSFVGLIALVIWEVMESEITSTASNLIFFGLGHLSSNVSSVVGFFFGSSSAGEMIMNKMKGGDTNGPKASK